MADYAPSIHQDNGGSLLAIDFEELALAVAAAAANGKTLVLAGRFLRAGIELANTGAAPLTDCIVQYQAHASSTWATYITAAELTAGVALAGRMDLIVGNPPALAAAAKSLMILHVDGLWAIRLVVTAAAPVNNTTVDIRGTAGR